MKAKNRSRPYWMLGTLAVVAAALVLAGTRTAAAPTEEVKKLTASDAETSNNFGQSVAVSGDTAIIGAHRQGKAAYQAGAAYVFQQDEGGPDNWGEVKKLSASDAQWGDLFGYSVAVSGDTAIVGAWGESSAATAAGAAYIYERDQAGTDNWGEVKKLAASDPEAADNFGWRVALSGDTAIVGAIGVDGAGWSSGAAYVFERDQGGPGNWGEVKKLTASDAQATDHFGTSVAVSGDTAVVGADDEDAGGHKAGAAYVFQQDEGGPDNWGEVKKLTASDAQATDHFGTSVAVSGDTAVVGAEYGLAGSNTTGDAYVFQRHEGGADNWGEVRKLTASDPKAESHFGASVAVSGDTAVVGAYLEDTGAGAAYVFQRHEGGTGNWGEVTKVTASDAQAADEFGWSVAVSGDTAVVGAWGEDAGGMSAGAAYVFGQRAVSTPTLSPAATDTPAPAATPPPVGHPGSLGLPDVGGPAGSSGPGVGLLAGVAATLASGVIVVGGAAWHARRRRP